MHVSDDDLYIAYRYVRMYWPRWVRQYVVFLGALWAACVCVSMHNHGELWVRVLTVAGLATALVVANSLSFGLHAEAREALAKLDDQPEWK